MSNSSDKAVAALLQKVKAKREEIDRVENRPEWKTDGWLSYDPKSLDRFNIQTIVSFEKLVEVYAFVNWRERDFYMAAEELDLPVDMKYMGHSFQDWKHDIKARAAQLTVDKRRKELEVLNQRVNKLVSPEQRRAMELAEIEKELEKR